MTFNIKWTEFNRFLPTHIFLTLMFFTMGSGDSFNRFTSGVKNFLSKLFKRTARGFLDIGHVDIHHDVDIYPDVEMYSAVDILSTHQHEIRCKMEGEPDSTQTSSCYKVSHSHTYLHHSLI